MVAKIVSVNLIILFSCQALIIFSIIPLYEQHLLEKHQQFSSSMVALALTVVERNYGRISKENITETEAQQRTIKQLMDMCSTNDYFWIHDLNLRMVAHPFASDLAGINLVAYTDSEGTRVFAKMNDIIRKNGQGFISYTWPKPSEEKAQPKISFVKLFAPWGWVVGSGTYIDDIKAETQRLKSHVATLSLGLLGLILVYSFYAARRINKPLETAVKITSAIVGGSGAVTAVHDSAFEPHILVNDIGKMVLKLKEQEMQYKNLVESTQSWIWEVDAHAIFTYSSPQIRDVVGYEDYEVMGKSIFDLLPAEEAVRLESIFTANSTNNASFQHVELTAFHKNGSVVLLDLSGVPYVDSRQCGAGYRGAASNISERKQSEVRREVNGEVLQLLYDSSEFETTIRQIITLIKAKIGLDAIAIRLQVGDDYPFLSEVGFPRELLETENSLLSTTEEHHSRCTKDAVCLDCTCGLVISGKQGCLQHSFTAGGSFWTNDSLQLVSLPAESDPRHDPRNRCVRYGFASLALIPIRYRDHVVGLMQCYSCCTNKFTKESILHLEGVAANVSAALMRKWTEEEKADLEDKLYQAQKMESIGRLAGGIAHDFNNMLSVIVGYAELGMMQVDKADPLNNYLVEINKAAERSADLTRQLLAFARKQTVTPKVLNLNDTVDGMFNMVQRLMGEQIPISWKPGNELWPVMVDPSQVDQIVVNLCVNARDAIGGAGHITITTDNKIVSEGFCLANKEAVPGDYVQLTVSDDGSGMDKETMQHIFEPFFTTKELGKGTGLGLATIYGVVRQNSGFITLDSELMQGTTFSIYLPRYRDTDAYRPSPKAAKTVPAGNETILLVEDDPAILKLTSLLLKKQGYSTLTAPGPREALTLAREYGGRIELLVTDVIMPEMNGRDLARQLLSMHPQLNCLFMSGYTADIISKQGMLDHGVHFIHKPFSLEQLAIKVREVLDGAGSFPLFTTTNVETGLSV